MARTGFTRHTRRNEPIASLVYKRAGFGFPRAASVDVSRRAVCVVRVGPCWFVCFATACLEGRSSRRSTSWCDVRRAKRGRTSWRRVTATLTAVQWQSRFSYSLFSRATSSSSISSLPSSWTILNTLRVTGPTSGACAFVLLRYAFPNGIAHVHHLRSLLHPCSRACGRAGMRTHTQIHYSLKRVTATQ